MSTVSGHRIARGKNGVDRGALLNPGSVATHAIPCQVQLGSLLDQVHNDLISPAVDPGRVRAAIDRLFRGLREIRLTSSADEWKRAVHVGRAHPLRQLVHQDPFTSRAFYKPRGYAGDAIMMDYIYGREENWSPPSATDLGAGIFDYTTSAPASAGVRERRCFITEMLDDVGHTRHHPHVLSVASGHLREVALSTTVRRGRFDRFVALDADAESLQEISRCYKPYKIETQVANIRRMLTGQIDLGTFDCVYSTGLYDYLVDSTARRLTANLFRSLKSQGRMVIANFLPEIRDIGYMEMYMDWYLVYRTRSEMLALADDIPQSQVQEIRILAERNDNVVIMELTKR